MKPQYSISLANYSQASEHYKRFRFVISQLLNTHAKIKVLDYPDNPEDYIEPTWGQCHALKSKDKILLIKQANGEYIQLVAGENKKLHRCKASEEEVQQLLEALT